MALIEVGHRAPDFALPRGAGQPVRFYGVAGGRPTLLLFTGDGDGAVLRALAAGLPDGRDLDTVTVRATATGGDATSDDFLDEERRVHDAYGIGDHPVVVLLDENLRVRLTAGMAEPDAVAAAITARLPAPSTDGEVAARQAPVLFVPRALAPDLRTELLERWATQGHELTGVETVVDGERAEATDVRRKRRRDHVVTDVALQRRLTQHIGSRVFPELQKAFAFAAGGFEGFKIGCYDEADAGHFEAHRDNLSTATEHRRFGLTLNLNDDYEGGELVFAEYGPTRYRPAAGEALLFSGSQLHEVRPVTRGRRFVLVSFVLEARHQH